MIKMLLVPLIALYFIFLMPVVPSMAAELIDVKPVMTGTGVVIEVSADIPMTYTYYKVKGQARAVVDVADADPEKIEPLIVVNKGAVASISVDKAMVGDMTVSRLIFNLVSDSELSVKQAPNRKTLYISFGGTKTATGTEPAGTVSQIQTAPAPPPSVATPVVVPESKDASTDAVVPKPAAKGEEDPLGLDDKKAEPLQVSSPQSTALRTTKLEPVIPEVAVRTGQRMDSQLAAKGIVIGTTYIDIQMTGTPNTYKKLKLANPERLLIEIPCSNSLKIKSLQVKRFGIDRIRIGTTPGTVRVVFDASRSQFPAYEVVLLENSVRVNFK